MPVIRPPRLTSWACNTSEALFLFVALPPDPGPEDLPTGPGFFVYLSADGLTYFLEARPPAKVFPWTWPGRPAPATAADLAAGLAAGKFELWTPPDPGAGLNRFA